MTRRNKFNAKPQVVDGVRFASKAEAKRDAELLLLQRAGEIIDIERQPKFDLFVNGRKVCRYVADWSYWESDPTRDNRCLRRVVEDKKGTQTPAFKIKWALAKALHPEIEWRLS
jgi:hypothetical protein